MTVTWRIGTIAEANPLLAEHHYLGSMRAAQLVVIGEDNEATPVACQIWRRPTSRNLPSDGTWLELSRWCLTPAAGPNAGSRCHRATVPLLRAAGALTLVSYSDPSAGHTGSLYRACNWTWAPTWHRLRPPPTGNGNWGGGKSQAVKDRWVFHVARKDPARAGLVVTDRGAIRYWQKNGTDTERQWAARSPYLPEEKS
jgi:hypothetical protein